MSTVRRGEGKESKEPKAGKAAAKSAQFLAVIRPYPRVLVVMHDNPDPDAIATGWAIKFLIEKRTRKQVRLVGGGAIVRAENRQMVKLLQPPLELVDDLQIDQQTAIVLVDCGAEATNHLVSGEPIHPVAVIDHHVTQMLMKVAHTDIRPRVAASATIATKYLREQELEPTLEMATALLYAIRTETRGSETHYSRLDKAAIPWLTRRADPGLLAEIENAPLPRTYFGDLVLALQATFVYGDAAFCVLPRAQGPEIIGEVADLLIRCEGIQRVLCGAVCGESILVSVRTTKDAGDATELLLATIRGLGRGGGHPRRAGGKLSATASGKKVPEEIQDELRTRWLEACNVPRSRGVRLMPKREIMGNL